MSRTVLAVRGLSTLGVAELDALCACADAIGLPADGADWLACVIAFETAGSFSPAQRNNWAVKDAVAKGKPYSGAVGLIQFMGATAAALGTTSAALEAMTFVEQISGPVRRYLATYAARCRSLEDLYLAVFYPAAIGQADSWVVASQDGDMLSGRATATPKEVERSKAVYRQNAGFDHAKRGFITRGDICGTIRTVHAAAGGKRRAVDGDTGETRTVEPATDGAALLTAPESPAPLLDLTQVARDADDAARRG